MHPTRTLLAAILILSAAGASVAQPATGPSATPVPDEPEFNTRLRRELGEMGTRHARGASRVGQILAGEFQPGQTLARTITLTPGRCYSVLAVGAGPTYSLSLVLVSPPAGTSPILASTRPTNGVAILTGGANGGANCYRWNLPQSASASIVVTATSGQGIVAAQVYER